MFLRCGYPQPKKKLLNKKASNKTNKKKKKQTNKMPPLVVRVESNTQLPFETDRK